MRLECYEDLRFLKIYDLFNDDFLGYMIHSESDLCTPGDPKSTIPSR
jgi:hypothetical protein